MSSEDCHSFVPSCKYNFESDNFLMPEKALHEDLIQEIIDITRVLRLPRADDIRTQNQTHWVCVKDGVIMPDPICITILCDAVFGEHDDINVYVGGDIAPDGEMHLYGKYNRRGMFVPGK